MKLREATGADVAALLELWRRAEAAPSVTDTPEDVAHAISARSTIVLLAIDGDTVIGSVIAAFDGWRGNYYRLAVDPAYRRRGIALQLVEAAGEWLAAAGVKRVSALVEGHRPIAQAFWTRAGFAHHEGMMRFTKSL